ncbi:glycoside hydrolase family 47 protein [Apodospora peruviana]|uniref:alpha-1,2-Mannosidase n=1 Tax=Apodospora peruviana TaxID=516989 RepID=A0AAE0IJI4_9PEZI|nr:glycoside hydrolase family 47 protein [Apodospora peruviana]
MLLFSRRRVWALILTGLIFFFLISFRRLNSAALSSVGLYPKNGSPHGAGGDSLASYWARIKPHYPVDSMRPLPTGSPSALPPVQTTFAPESATDRSLRLDRQAAVKDAFLRCWKSYRQKAWMSDELAPISGHRKGHFGGWGATLVDSLDTLWIMGLREQFDEAVAAAASISFETTTIKEVNVFETNIRYLGGFLAAYDLSGDARLLKKAREVGDMLYAAFDTPNRMPMTRWDLHAASRGQMQVAHEHVLLAEIGTFSLEFIRLSLLTGDPKWFDAVQRIMEAFQEQQQTSHLPGMWPVVVNARKMEFDKHTDYTLNAMADSLYEYLPKTHALVGGLLPMYREMYEASMDTAIRYNFFRPMVPDGNDILISGMISAKSDNSHTKLRPEGQHLGCYTGGMLALGGKLIQNQTHVGTGEKLMDGCVWAYQAAPLGIMPELFYALPCKSTEQCAWDEKLWVQEVIDMAGLNNLDVDSADAEALIAKKRLPKGYTHIPDARYILRPEAIESVFVLYRITGRQDLIESAWKMFEAIDQNTRTELANSALGNVLEDKPPMSDSMESFWLGETLKYFYLMFSEPDLISLDEYVFNTEAHPLKRLLPT